MPTRVIPTFLALVAFAVAMIAGLLVSNPPLQIVGRALLSAGGAYVFGYVIASIAQRAVEEHVERQIALEREPVGTGSTEAPESVEGDGLQEQAVEGVDAPPTGAAG